MKKFFEEFKKFITRGNVLDMAVGVIVGGAFTGIVTSLTDSIINPLITFITGGSSTEIGGLVVPGTGIDFGAFISAIINFLIIAVILFAMIKAMNTARDKAAALASAAAEKAGIAKEEEEEEEPIVCPHCLEEIKEGATRCPHCAGEIPAQEEVPTQE